MGKRVDIAKICKNGFSASERVRYLGTGHYLSPGGGGGSGDFGLNTMKFSRSPL